MAESGSAKPVLKVVVALFLVAVLAGCSGGNPKGGPPRPGQNFIKDQAGRFDLAAGDLLPGHKKVGSQSGPVACDSGYLANSGAIEETAGLSVAVTFGMTEADVVAIGRHLNARAVK